MGVLDDCAEFINTVGPNVSLFRTGSAAKPVDARIGSAIRAVAQAPGHHLLVESADLNNENLRNYIQSATSRGIDLVVDAVDSATMDLVSDPAALRVAHEQLGVAVGVPESTDRLVPAAIRQRQESLRKLTETDFDPSMARMTEFLSTLPGSHVDIGTTLGALIALNGDLPSLPTVDLAASNAPMARPTAQRGLDTNFARFDFGGVVSAVTNGARALVHGWMPGASRPQTFLFFSDSGRKYWVDPSKGPGAALVETTLESDDDARLILERPSTEVMLLDANNAALPVPQRPVASVQDREGPGVTRVGEWSAPTRMGRQILDQVGSYGNDNDNVIFLQPRRGPKVNGQPTLDNVQKTQLNEAIRRLDRPVVISTDPNEDLNAFATVQHDADVLAPRSIGFDRVEWEVISPGRRERDRYYELTPDLIARVVKDSDANKPLPPMLQKLLRSDSWRAVAEIIDAERANISTPENAARLQDMVNTITAKAAQPNPLGPGTIGEGAFYLPDRTLPALSVMLKVDVRALTDPRLSDRPTMEPMSYLVTEEIAPTGTRFDAVTILGYLTNRSMSLPSDQRLDFDMGVIRLRDMFRPWIGTDYGPITSKDLTILLGAKGEWASERGSRQPGAPELDRGHAEVAKVIGDIYDKGLSTVDPEVLRELVDAIDCFTGIVRVAYHYTFKLVINPAVPQVAPAMEHVSDEISRCH